MSIDRFCSEKFSLLQYVIYRENELYKSGLGRTALMKLVYLLQAGKGIPVGYDFRLYSYGPYDSQVISDLNSLSQYGYLKEERVQEENYQWYKYIPMSEKCNINEKSQLLNGNRATIDEMIEKFGNNSARKLELFATTLFVLKDRTGKDIKTLINTIKEIKPKYDKSEINAALEKVQNEFFE